MFKLLKQAVSHGLHTLTERRVYLVCLTVVPIAFTLFFISLMDEGLPLKVPSGVVDLDHSSLSREVTRSLGSSELVDICERPESYHKAMEAVRSGKINGFFMIPENFQRNAIGGRTPTITYYCNLTYFVPGSLMFKGFKTTAVTTAGALVQTDLVSAGVSDRTASTLIQPMTIQIQAIGNPWMNYNYYLTNSFVPGVIALMVALVAAYTICVEIKERRSRLWLERSGNSIVVALAGMLGPQTVIAIAVGVACQALMYGFNHFPMNCPSWHMVLAMALMVIASQSFAVTMCCLIPNLRLAVSLCSLSGILAFSLAAFSFPVSSMYPALGAFSYILPVRYYFLIYIDQALNGIPLYYSRWFYIVLALFPLLPLCLLWRLKKRLLAQQYIP
ncbi:MAG: ABC transporter permease [Firmicutes bacterium]|nr:ABC transporter permease [Bacillota bacterium]MCM1402109.1 ABC transporter permease [Bacteroides sp.]MCM1477514.1 ABC transporter permease [Bacteroides sp.]